MKEVFLLTEYIPYEGETIFGVFSTEQLAIDAGESLGEGIDWKIEKVKLDAFRWEGKND